MGADLAEETRTFNAEPAKVLAAVPGPHEFDAPRDPQARREGGGPFPAPVRLDDGVGARLGRDGPWLSALLAVTLLWRRPRPE
ncbi:hypothetical protein ACQP1W_32425 [Spirillospora sp. CA-255316]